MLLLSLVISLACCCPARCGTARCVLQQYTLDRGPTLASSTACPCTHSNVRLHLKRSHPAAQSSLFWRTTGAACSTGGSRPGAAAACKSARGVHEGATTRQGTALGRLNGRGPHRIGGRGNVSDLRRGASLLLRQQQHGAWRGNQHNDGREEGSASADRPWMGSGAVHSPCRGVVSPASDAR